MITVNGKYAFQPAIITIHAGQTVAWINDSNAPHTVTADDASWSSATVTHGQSYARRFAKAGTFHYVCGLHGYMTGTVIVKP